MMRGDSPMTSRLTRRAVIRVGAFTAMCMTVAACGKSPRVRIDRNRILELLPEGYNAVPFALGDVDFDIPLAGFKDTREFHSYTFRVAKGYTLQEITPSTRISLSSLRLPRGTEERFAAAENVRHFRYITLGAAEQPVAKEFLGTTYYNMDKVRQAIANNQYIHEGDFFRINSPDVVGPFVYMIADPDFTFMGFREIIFQVNRKPIRPPTDKYPVGRQISMKFRISPRVRCVIQLTEGNVALHKIPEFLKLLEAELLAILTPASRAALGLTY